MFKFFINYIINFKFFLSYNESTNLLVDQQQIVVGVVEYIPPLLQQFVVGQQKVGGYLY